MICNYTGYTCVIDNTRFDRRVFSAVKTYEKAESIPALLPVFFVLLSFPFSFACVLPHLCAHGRMKTGICSQMAFCFRISLICSSE